MSSSNDKNEYVCVWAEDIVGRDVRVHVRADGVDEDAPIWSGLLDAIVAVGDFVDGTKFHQFRDIYSGNTIGDDPIAAAIDHACTLRDARVALSLIGFDVRSAEIVVTEEQVRRLAQVGGSLQISVGLSGSD